MIMEHLIRVLMIYNYVMDRLNVIITLLYIQIFHNLQIFVLGNLVFLAQLTQLIGKIYSLVIKFFRQNS